LENTSLHHKAQLQAGLVQAHIANYAMQKQKFHMDMDGMEISGLHLTIPKRILV
jgi:hypothetical protein